MVLEPNDSKSMQRNHDKIQSLKSPAKGVGDLKRALLYWGVACLTILALNACVKDDDNQDINLDPGYGYFPIDIGHYVVYKADSIWHDNPTEDSPGVHDTTSYFIKELIESEFQDASGETSMRLERFKRNSEDEPWNLADVWFISRNNLNGQKVEENVRYVKMGFPISASSSWDGNALNIRDSWTYRYDSLYVDRIYHEVNYPRTVKVLQRDNKNFVEDQLAYEIYAPEVGLIYRYHRDLTTRLNYTNAPTAENIRFGIEFRWEILEYGQE